MDSMDKALQSIVNDLEAKQMVMVEKVAAQVATGFDVAKNFMINVNTQISVSIVEIRAEIKSIREILQEHNRHFEYTMKILRDGGNGERPLPEQVRNNKAEIEAIRERLDEAEITKQRLSEIDRAGKWKLLGVIIGIIVSIALGVLNLCLR